MLRRKAEELQLLEDRYQQQRQQLMSLQDEREQLKRVSAALEEKSREEEAVYRRLEVDMFAMQVLLKDSFLFRIFILCQLLTILFIAFVMTLVRKN